MAKAARLAKKGEDKVERLAGSWISEIDAALKREDTWRTQGKKVVQRYRDERDAKATDNRVNILWANTEVLKSALYARTAKPDVRRRFPDAKRGNTASRYAAETVERGLIYCADAYDVDTPIMGAVEDSLLPGRGVIWVSYDPEIEGEEIVEQALKLEYVYWEDFCHGLARRWCDVPWVARRHGMRKSEFDAKFPNVTQLKGFTADYEIEDAGGKKAETSEKDKFVEVWEVWNKATKERLYVARGYREVLKADEDPLGLTGFFPCPQPLYSVTTTDRLTPEPEFRLYQDQANELDNVSNRISKLIEQLRWRGVYDAGMPESDVLKNIASAGDGEFLPHQNFQAIRDKGGIDAAFGFMPIDRIIMVVRDLYTQRAQMIQTIYEITGISDIVRGATDPRETKGAQQLKAQFGSMRMQRRQRDVQRFIRDAYRMKAEIIAEHFTQETLAEITALDLPTKQEQAMLRMRQMTAALPAPSPAQAPMQAPPMAAGGAPAPMQGGAPPAPQQPPQAMPQQQPPQMGGNVIPMPQRAPSENGPRTQTDRATGATWEDVMAILRSDKMRGYRIDIETDSTVMEDAQTQKAERTEFMAAFQTAMAGAYQAAIAAPMTLPLIKESVLFLMRTYKVGRSMEQQVEDVFDELAENPPAPPPEQGGKAAPPDDGAKLALEDKKIEQEGMFKTGQLKLDSEKLELEREKMEREAAMREQERSDAGLPAGHQIVAMAEQVMQQTGAISQALAGIAQRLEQQGQQIDALVGHVQAPVEVIKDASGRAIGVRKGMLTQTVVRGPDGRPVGLQ